MNCNSNLFLFVRFQWNRWNFLNRIFLHKYCQQLNAITCTLFTWQPPIYSELHIWIETLSILWTTHNFISITHTIQQILNATNIAMIERFTENVSFLSRTKNVYTQRTAEFVIQIYPWHKPQQQIHRLSNQTDLYQPNTTWMMRNWIRWSQWLVQIIFNCILWIWLMFLNLHQH